MKSPDGPLVSRPVYDRPPVVETLLGIQFKPLKEFGSVHYGLLWHDFFADQGWYPAADEPLLDRYAESFANAQLKANQLRGNEEDVVGVRVRFRNEAKDRSLQFQPDKLYFSWLRAAESTSDRPHYSELKTEFDEVYQKLVDFAEKSEMGPLVPDLWEVKYLNQVSPGSLWTEPGDWHRVLPKLFQPSLPSSDGLNFATFEGEWFYEIKPKLGRVRVRVAKMLVNQKPPPILYLRLLARGEIGESGVPDWSSGFDVGHQACNQLFNAITSPEAQKEWGITDES